MKSRLIAGFSAIVLALVGAMIIFAYTANADNRALADLEPVEVLVVREHVPAGTKAGELSDFVALMRQPAATVASTALKDLKTSAGKVTAVDLVPGEQLIAERLVAPEDLPGSGLVEIPKGLQEVSFQLEPQRVVGGDIAPGDHVGVYISFDEGASKGDPLTPTTQLVLHKKLVTAVQGAPPPVTEESAEKAQTLPAGSLLMTLAVDDVEAGKIVFGAEFGHIWLSKQPPEAKESKRDVIEKTEVYR